MASASTVIGAGELRESIRFERRSSASDGAGNVQGSWQPLFTGVRARIQAVSGMSHVIASGLQAVATVTVWTRWSPNTRQVTEADRIVDERTGTVYLIRQIANGDEVRKFLQFTAERGVGSY